MKREFFTPGEGMNQLIDLAPAIAAALMESHTPEVMKEVLFGGDPVETAQEIEKMYPASAVADLREIVELYKINESTAWSVLTIAVIKEIMGRLLG